MKNVILAIFVFFTIMFSGLSILNNYGQFINLHNKDIHRTHHTFRMYESWTSSLFGVNPISKCSIPILTNGNYPNNPTSAEMNEWIITSAFNHSHFTLENFIFFTK